MAYVTLYNTATCAYVGGKEKVFVKGDCNRFLQVLMNVMSNAMKVSFLLHSPSLFFYLYDNYVMLLYLVGLERSQDFVICYLTCVLIIRMPRSLRTDHAW